MALRWILGGLTGVTLYFQTNLADPFNSPKLWVLLIVSAYLFGYIVRFREFIYTLKDLKISFYLVAFFITSCLVVTLLTDSKYIAFFGDTYRKNGFLTYLCFSLFFVAASIFIRHYNANKIFLLTYFIAVITVAYGSLQTLGRDFVNWTNPHNSLIGTQGNPNFAAATMAIMGVITLSSIFFSKTASYQKFLAGIIVLALLILIYRSNARQGMISFALGAGVFFIIWLFSKNKKLGFASMLLGGIFFVVGVLGMLQVGPLQQFLYKPSVTVRGFYWQAAIEMFKDNPAFGVGMDRFGAYFMLYRDLGYPLNYGFQITSSNAHNIFLQFFATGGILLGSSYLLLVIWIFTKALKGIKKLTGDDRLILGGVFSGWIAFQAQSFVSIDNIGLAIWGWFLGGTIIGLTSLNPTEVLSSRLKYSRKPNQIDLLRVLTSGATTLLTVLLVAVLYRGENSSFNASGTIENKDQSSIAIYREAQLRVIHFPLIDQSYSLKSAINLIEFGLNQDGFPALINLHKRDPRNLDTLNSLAAYHEFRNEFNDAIVYREKIIDLNPWDAVNYLALGQDYKKIGNTQKSQEMLTKILSFASGPNGGPIAERAKKELIQ